MKNKIKGMNADSDPSALPETEYICMPNAKVRNPVYRLTLDFYSYNPNDKIMNTLDKNGITIEQGDNKSIYLEKDIEIKIAEFILNGYNAK